MKKVALSLLALAMTGMMAYAQDAAAAPAPVVSIGEWGRQIFAIGNQDSSGYFAGLGASWGNTPRIVGLNINAHTDTVGFSITPSADNGTFGLTDQNKAWINPMPGLQVEAGLNLETDTWRGTGDFGSWDWLRLPGTVGDSITFFRLGEFGGQAFDVNYNKDGIGAWALVATNLGGTATTDVGTGLQAGAAYAVPSVGTIKAQFFGSGVAPGVGAASIQTGKAYGTINAAFNLSAIKDLYEEVGVLVPSSSSDAGYTFQLSDVVGYQIDKAKLNGNLVLNSYNGNLTGRPSGMGLKLGVGVDYDLGNKLTLNTDVRYTNPLELAAGANTSLNAMTGVLVGVTQGYSNGLIGVGFEYSTVAWGGGSTTNTSQANAHWAIPVRMEYWF